MKLIRQLTPYMILLLLAFAQVIETSTVTKIALRRMKALNKSQSKRSSTKFSVQAFDETNTLSVWEAFKAATPMNYVDVFFGFLGAWDSKIAGAWGTFQKISGV